MDIDDTEFVVILDDEELAGLGGSGRRRAAAAGGYALQEGNAPSAARVATGDAAIDATMGAAVDSANAPLRASLMTRPRVMAWEHGHLVMRAPRAADRRRSRPSPG